MSIMFTFIAILTITYFIFKFAQQENVEEYYQQTILDIEALQDWAASRTTYPFGMKAQIEISNDLLHQAKILQGESEYQHAYQVARQSWSAINKAQKIYILAAKNSSDGK